MKRLIICLEHEGRVLFEGESDSLELPLQIGRSKECAWTVAGIDGSMSGRHAEIYLKRGSPWIRDLGSKNGITCTEGRVANRRLKPGDRLHMGACVLTVEEKLDRKAAELPEFNRLEQLNGPCAGTVFELKDSGEIPIGSGATNGILCLDPLVSREHAVLSVKGDGSCWVRDLGSRNGTSVNGLALAKGKERLLRDGDVLSIAYIEFRFVDRNVVHPKAHLLRKTLVALATIAIALIGYYSYATVRPSSRMLLKKAIKLAEYGRFDEAAEAAESAGSARGATAYVNHRQNVLADIAKWRKTADGWRMVKDAIATRDWTMAQVESVRLVSWEWNSTTAPLEGVRAERALALVRALRSAQRALAESDGAEVLEVEEKALAGAIAALRDPSISSDGGLAFADALLADAGQVAPELAATRADLLEVEEIVRRLKAGDMSAMPHGARDTLAHLAALSERSAARNAGRAGDATFTPSKAVESRIGEMRAPLRALVKSEEVFAANVGLVASGRGGRTEATLPLPPASLAGISDTFPKYASYLERMNAVLCGQVEPGWRSRLSEMAKVGIDQSGRGSPSVLTVLFSDDVASKVLEFVPSPSVEVVRISDGPPSQKLIYHLFVGIFDFADLLESVEPGVSPNRAIAAYGKVGEGWETVIEETRRVCQTMRSFRDYAEHTGGDAGALSRLVVRARVADGGNAVATCLATARQSLEKVEEWSSVTFPEICRKNGSARAEVLALGVRLLLAESPTKDDATKLAESYRSLKRTLPRWDGDMGTAHEIFRTALPGMNAHTKAWSALNKEGQ